VSVSRRGMVSSYGQFEIFSPLKYLWSGEPKDFKFCTLVAY